MSEFDPDSNGHADEYNNFHPPRNGRRSSLRRSFERQLSDKHLKRRLQLQNDSRKFLYEDPLSTISSLHEQSYDWHNNNKRPNAKYRRKRFLVLGVLIAVVFLIVLPTIWYSTLLSSSSSLSSMQGTMGDSGDSGDVVRSYQDLADSIRSLRKRRQAQRDEAMGEGQIGATNDDIIKVHPEEIYNEEYVDKDQEDEDTRLKRLEQKIQRDQNEKVRQEFLENNSIESKDVYERIKGVRDEESDKIALKNKVMSENIAALKLFNDNKHKKSG